jgi:4-amino-4-deoxychorismate lyase
MILVDGRAAVVVSARDRGLNYGDGLFEAIRLHAGRLPLLDRHLLRLAAGCRRLGLSWPGEEVLRDDMAALLEQGSGEGVLRLLLTRGDGGRGYAPPADARTRRIASLHELPPPAGEALSLGVCTTRLGDSPALAGLKHLGRLEQVLGAAEAAAAGWDEGLMLDARDRVVEGTRHNVFVVRGGRVYTPPVDRCGVAGVMRSLILEVLAPAGLGGGEAPLRYHELDEIDEMFLCNAVAGMRRVKAIEGRSVHSGAVTDRVQALLAEAGVAWLA